MIEPKGGPADLQRETRLVGVGIEHPFNRLVAFLPGVVVSFQPLDFLVSPLRGWRGKNRLTVANPQRGEGLLSDAVWHPPITGTGVACRSERTSPFRTLID